ncbi:MAG: hypothetical protein ACRDOV_06470, partial [Streptomyces sp.]
MQADSVGKGVGVAGELEVDEAGVGEAGLVEEEVVGLRIAVAERQERAWVTQLGKCSAKFGLSLSGEGGAESCGVSACLVPEPGEPAHKAGRRIDRPEGGPSRVVGVGMAGGGGAQLAVGTGEDGQPVG